jgi:D-sedoheptulose 7-phosphate isomerase
MSIDFFSNYSKNLNLILESTDWSAVEILAQDLKTCWLNGNNVFLCGNGGSAGNASHLTNDLIYGVAKKKGEGIKSISLSDNLSVITCLANDVGYENIFSEQLAVLGNKGDILIALSGSGNSSNIISVIHEAHNLGIKSHAILGFDGGEAKKIVNNSIHFDINDMQLSEDLQLIVGHMLMKWLYGEKKQL